MKKVIRSPEYNLLFDTETGFMARWGRTKDDDPEMCPWGPEIADIEISTVCNGIGKDVDSRKPCVWCYKSNTGQGENMNLETFKNVFAKLNQAGTLTQIAFGIGDLDANPDLWDIMGHCREHNVIPNITVNGMGIDDDDAAMLAMHCGAVAVSHYGINHGPCFDTIKRLTDQGLRQVNIHKLLSRQTYKDCFRLIDQVRIDPRTRKLKAIVFLLLKPKGDRNDLDGIVSLEEYKTLMSYAIDKGVSVGMDSCSAPMVLRILPEQYVQSVEPCESTLFSIYVNVRGEMFPCSFTEGTPGWEVGVPLDSPLRPDDAQFLWYNPRIVEWRRNLLASSSGCSSCDVQRYCRSCPVYDVTVCQPKPHLRSNESLVQIKRKEKTS